MLRARRLAVLLAVLPPLALAAPPARAQGDLRSPYHLRVVLHVARQRLLTEIFRQRLERELRDGLQGALGELGHVEVVRDHPKLADVLRDGLERALDGWAERSDVKTHFVLVDYSGVHYEIQARQFDGIIGRPSPVVRHDRTRDRAFVGKAAALLVKQDFGLLGTVQTEPDAGGLVKVELRGGGLDVPWGRWVQPGDVFALVNAQPGGSSRIDWALVQVKGPPAEGSQDGVCTCRLFHRYALPRVAGLRCIKLGTVKAPLRLRFMREVPSPTGPRLLRLDTTLTVEVRRHGFTGEDATRLRLTTDASGDIDTSREGEKGLFDHVAFVSVSTTGAEKQVAANVPVALVADRQMVVETTAARNDLATQVALKVITWQRDVAECYLVQVQLFKQINALTAKPDQLARALEEVRKTLERSKQDRARLGAERDAIMAQARKLPKQAQPNLAASERLLTQIESGETQLRKHLTQLEDDLRKENDPQRRDWLARVKQGQLLEEDFEVGKAIKVYEKLLAEGFKNEDLSKHLDELKQKWEPKDEPHKDARQFIYYVWPTLDNAGLKANLGKAEEALAVCRRVNPPDTIAAGRLFRATEAHAVRMKKESDALRPDINIDDEPPAKLIKEVAPGLEKLARDIQTFLNSKRPAD
jgi:hypothetical protein